jgi:hypothetical protein
VSSRAGHRVESDITTRGPSVAAAVPRQHRAEHPPARLLDPNHRLGGLAAHHVLGLQRRAGNAAVASRLAATSGTEARFAAVQRVMTGEALVEQQYTGFFGNTGSEQYMAVIGEVKQYHGRVDKGMRTRGTLAQIRTQIDAWRKATAGQTGEKLDRRRMLIDQLEAEVDEELAAQNQQGERMRAECDEAVRQIDRDAPRPRPDDERKPLAGLKVRFQQRGNEVANRLGLMSRDSLHPVDKPLETAHKRDRDQLAQALLPTMRMTAIGAMNTVNSSNRFKYRHNMPDGQRVYRMPQATWAPASPLSGSPATSAVLNFTAKGKPAVAVLDLFRSADIPIVIECTAAISICYLRAILETVGADQFNRLFASGISITNAISDEVEPLLKQVTVTDSSEVRAGDWVYFLNHLNYPELHDRGAFSGENSLALGTGQYEGFGVRPVSELEMVRTLAKAMFTLSDLVHYDDEPTNESNVGRVEKLLDKHPSDMIRNVRDALVNRRVELKSKGEYNKLVAEYNKRLFTSLAAYTDADTLATELGIPGLGKRRGPTGPSGPTATAERTVGRLEFDPIAITS